VSDIMLSVKNLEAGYAGVQALHGVSLEVRERQIVALLGANGAGKSTLLRTLSAIMRASAGTVIFDGIDITSSPAHKLPCLGLVHVPEGRRIFGTMTIKENLTLGSFTVAEAATRQRRMDHVFHLFPVLAERRDKDAVFLSGGEQQMLALGRAMMAGPKLLLLDEPSMGLAPLMVKEIMRIIKVMNDAGVAILLVEQNSKAALKLASYGYVLENGQITLSAPAQTLANDDAIVRAYLGSAQATKYPI
jgi:branched-chain amino acid transport system ATP-binding protein